MSRDNTLSKGYVLFFDFEFYVPKKNRNKIGLQYNPYDEDSLFLGGYIYTTNFKDEFDFHNFNKFVDSFFIWNYPNEKNLINSIYIYLKKIMDEVKNNTNNKISPNLCGIGITHSDIQILIQLIIKHRILTPYEAFEFINNFRSVDLSVLGLGAINNPDMNLYPRTKNQLVKSHFPEKKFESGKIVWDLYENRKFKSIEKRVKHEIVFTYELYKLLSRDFNYSNKLKKSEINRKKQKRNKSM